MTRVIPECGTWQAEGRHRRRMEPIDEACWKAGKRHRNELKAARELPKPPKPKPPVRTVVRTRVSKELGGEIERFAVVKRITLTEAVVRLVEAGFDKLQEDRLWVRAGGEDSVGIRPTAPAWQGMERK